MRSIALLICTALFFISTVPQADAADISRDDLKKALKELLHEEPEIVMDIVKQNSETILEVAQQGNMLRKRRALTQQWEKDLLADKNIDTSGRPSRGNPNAPVTIVMFSDYACTYCKQAEVLLDLLLDAHKDSLRLVFFHYPKEQETSIISAKYSLAAFLQDVDKGWKLHKKLFDNLPEFEKNNDEFMKKACAELGLDYKKLRSDVANNKQLATLLAENSKEADRLHVTGTPHFFVNNIVIQGLLTAELFEEAINMALAAQQ